MKKITLVLICILLAAVICSCSSGSSGSSSGNTVPAESAGERLLDLTANTDLAALTDLAFPVENGRLSKDDVYALFDVAERICENYDRLILSDQTDIEIPEALTDDEAATILANVSYYDLETLEALHSRLEQRDRAVGYLFWDLVNAYLPEGAADLLVKNPKSNSIAREWAILDLGASGYNDKKEARSAQGDGNDYSAYTFETLEFHEDGRLWYCPGDGSMTEIFNADRRDRERVVWDEVLIKLAAREQDERAGAASDAAAQNQ